MNGLVIETKRTILVLAGLSFLERPIWQIPLYQLFHRFHGDDAGPGTLSNMVRELDDSVLCSFVEDLTTFLGVGGMIA